MSEPASPSRRLRNKHTSADLSATRRRQFRHKYSPKGWRRVLRTLRHALEYAALRLLVGSLRLLGVERASAASGLLWRAVAPRTKRHERALAHLAIAFPDKTALERENIARAMWENLGRTAAEAFMLDKILRDEWRIAIATPDVINSVGTAQGKAVVASMHYGNWELGIWPFTHSGFASIGLYQKLQNPFVEAWVLRLRQRLFPGGIYSKNHATPLQLLRAVRQGKPMGILADLRDVRGIDVPFFGQNAPTTTFPALIARHENAVLIAGRVIRLKGASFRLEAKLIDVPHTGDKNADTAEATRRLQAVFEEWITERPDLWMWAHQRWGKRRIIDRA